jgi:hypothetical protein
MADFNKLGGLPSLGYGPSVIEQAPVVKSASLAPLYEDVGNAAEQAGQVFRHNSNEEARVAGEKAVSRDADGNIHVANRDSSLIERIFLPENAGIYENAATARWLSETSIDIDKSLTKAHFDHALDPQGFDAAVSGIRQSFLGNIPGQLGDPGLIAPHLDEAISRAAAQHSKNILETKFNADMKSTANSIGAKISRNSMDMGNLVRAHATNTEEYKRLEAETINLIRTKVGNPAFAGYTQEQADNDVKALQSDLRVEAMIGHLEDYVKDNGIEKGKEYLDAQRGHGAELGLDPDDLDKFLTRGKTLLSGAEAEQHKQTAEFQDKNFTDFDLRAEHGQLSEREILDARKKGLISEPAARSLIDKVNVKTKDNSELNDSLNRLAQGLPLDSANGTDRKAVDIAFESLTAKGADPIGLTIRFAQTAGVLPGKVVSRLRGASQSNDPAYVAQGLDMGRQIIEAVPDAFDKMPGGDSMAKDAEQFRHLTRDMGMSDQEAAQRIIAQRDPAVRRRNAEVVDSFRKEIGDIKANDMLTSMSLRGFWSRITGSTPNAGLTDGQSAQALADYKSFVTERLKETGDLDSAKAIAAQDMRKLYGVTTVGGTPALTKYPPENKYPKVMGSWDYIREQAASDAREALHDPKIKPEDVQVVPSTQTAQDWAKGTPPRYTVMVKRGDTWVALPSGYWRPDPKKAAGTAATDYAAARKKAAGELNPVINQPNVVPGL